MTYRPTIGLEVHAELKTESKMFCGCKNQPHDGAPNTHICPVCLAHPGTLPVPNEEAIAKVLQFGKAVEATVAEYSEFDRKNYFYPDIPKAYQISQYAYPFLIGGTLADVALTRVHLEEDTARNQHDQGEGSLVDFNRAGVPLMELVTEPVIHDEKSAGHFAKELQLLLRTLGISNAQMERGEMRVEANISVSKDEKTLGTKVEVKNLNSFKSVEAAIRYEVERQTAVLERGDEVKQETRGWDEVKLKTFSQRSKETAKDYRYFPDPDIPKIAVTQHPQFSESLLAENLPKLPSFKRTFYKNLGLPHEVIEQLISDPEVDSFLQTVVDTKSSSDTIIKLAVNYLLTDIAALRLGKGALLSDLKPDHLLELMTMLEKGDLSSRAAKDLLIDLFAPNAKDPRTLATEKGILQKSSKGELQTTVEEIITANPAVVDEYRSGKDSALQFLIGQGMKVTKGAANPNILRELLI